MYKKKEKMKKLAKKIEAKVDLESILEYEKRVEDGDVEFFSIDEVKEHLGLEGE